MDVSQRQQSFLGRMARPACCSLVQGWIDSPATPSLSPDPSNAAGTKPFIILPTLHYLSIICVSLMKIRHDFFFTIFQELTMGASEGRCAILITSTDASDGKIAGYLVFFFQAFIFKEQMQLTKNDRYSRFHNSHFSPDIRQAGFLVHP